MSNIEPMAPYVYQPDPPFNKDGTRNERIYGLAGPGAEKYYGKRFTRTEAEAELAKVIEADRDDVAERLILASRASEKSE